MVHSPQWAWVHELQSANFYHKNLYSSDFQGFYKIFGPQKFGAIQYASFFSNKFRGRGQPMFLELGGGYSLELKYTINVVPLQRSTTCVAESCLAWLKIFN